MAGLYGISHTTHSLDGRAEHLGNLKTDTGEPQVLLQTCNRIEVYSGRDNIEEETVKHLFRVASGLESSLTGEGAILGQVRKAYYEAKEKYTLSPVLNKMFQCAIHTGKRVRTETGISKGAVSHSQATARMVSSSGVDLNTSLITVVGVNPLTEDLIKFLTREGARTIILANRNLAKAEFVAAKYGCGAVPLAEKRKFIPSSDILVCATSASHYIIREGDIPPGKRLVMFDISFPRNIDPAVRRHEGVTLHDLEDIERYVREVIGLREEHIPRVERIIGEELSKFNKWYEGYKTYGRGKDRQRELG